MSDHNNTDNMFGGELGLDDQLTAHSGKTGAQTPTVLLAGAQFERPHVQRSVKFLFRDSMVFVNKA